MPRKLQILGKFPSGSGGSGGNGLSEEDVKKVVDNYFDENPVVTTVNGNAPDDNGDVTVPIPDSYSKSEIDSALGSYITDVAALVGGMDDTLPDGGSATLGKDGGYYTPSVTQPNANTMRMEFAASKADMPPVEAVEITLPAGAPGYTPQKGVDYFTADDKEQLVSDVLAALPVWEGSSY